MTQERQLFIGKLQARYNFNTFDEQINDRIDDLLSKGYTETHIEELVHQARLRALDEKKEKRLVMPETDNKDSFLAAANKLLEKSRVEGIQNRKLQEQLFNRESLLKALYNKELFKKVLKIMEKRTKE